MLTDVRSFRSHEGMAFIVTLAPSKEFFPSYSYSRLSKLPEEKKIECIEQISIFLTNAIMIITARAERLARLENNASFVLS